MKKDFVKSIPWDLPHCKRQQKEKWKKRKNLNLEEKLSYLSNFEVKLEKIAVEFEIRRLKFVRMQRFILKKKID